MIAAVGDIVSPPLTVFLLAGGACWSAQPLMSIHADERVMSCKKTATISVLEHKNRALLVDSVCDLCIKAKAEGHSMAIQHAASRLALLRN